MATKETVIYDISLGYDGQ